MKYFSDCFNVDCYLRNQNVVCNNLDDTRRARIRHYEVKSWLHVARKRFAIVLCFSFNLAIRGRNYVLNIFVNFTEVFSSKFTIILICQKIRGPRFIGYMKSETGEQW